MTATPRPSGLVQGTLDMLILKTLALERMHGFGIGARIEQISKGVFQVNAGSLFPAFRRLERDGLIASEWEATENNRRAKYYRLTARGARQAQTQHPGLGSPGHGDRENSSRLVGRVVIAGLKTVPYTSMLMDWWDTGSRG